MFRKAGGIKKKCAEKQRLNNSKLFGHWCESLAHPRRKYSQDMNMDVVIAVAVIKSLSPNS